MLLASDVATRLELTARAVGTLGKTGVLTPQPVGTALIYEESQILGLEQRQPPPPDAVTAWVVRLSAPFATGDPERPIAGWHESWSEEEKRAAASRYWRIAHPADYRGTALVALVTEFVVGVWDIIGGETFRGMTAFELSDATEPQRNSYMGAYGRRMNLGRGPVVRRYPL